MASLKDLIEQRIDRLESVPNNLLTAIDKQNELLFKTILKELNALEVKDGNIVTSTENLARVGAIVERLNEVLFGGDYVDAIKIFATEIAQQASINNQILDKVVGSFEDSELYNATIKSAQRNALLLLDDAAVKAELLQPITDILTNAIVNSASFTDSVETLRHNMTGEAALLTKYARTYAHDSFAAADRQYSQLTAREHNIEFYKYSGGRVDDTRLFCLERVGKTFHAKECEAWGANQNTRPGEFLRPANKPVYINPNGVKLYWEGENYNTTPQTFFSYVAGYNCQHVLLPVATENVSDADINRAIGLGFYRP